MDEKNLADMLYVGTIYVEVGVDWSMGTPTAQTVVPTLGATDLGGEISTQLVSYEDEDTPPKGYPPFESVEMWKMLLTQMRDLLARCFLSGEIRISVGLASGIEEVEGEAEKNLDAAITELGDEHFLIPVTPEHTIAALTSRKEDNERVQQVLETLLGFMQAQEEYEGEDIGIGEAVERGKRGTEKIRRIVEGEGDEDED